MANMRARFATIMAAVTAALLPLCTRAADYEVVDAATVAKMGGASGGDELRRILNSDSTYSVIHIFTNVTTATFKVPANAAIIDNSGRFLVVGGGGTGVGNCGGGGGGGGVVYKEGLTFESGDHEVVVGAGGAKPTSNSASSVGSDSSFTTGGTTYIGKGGGKGGTYQNGAGSTGGSGGGSSGSGAAGTSNQATYDGAGHGYSGGKGASNNVGGGGGGAGAAGSNATTSAPGKGGDGFHCDISGDDDDGADANYYGAGGGGGGVNTLVDAQGGRGGGGLGRGAIGEVPGDGKSGTGSGGGGAAGGGATGKTQQPGGAGGSGIVIVRYTLPIAAVFPVGAAESEVDGEKVYVYTDSSNPGKLILERATKVHVLVVGGGGAGANPSTAAGVVGGAGGGGAGGFIEKTGEIFQAGTYTINVGSGGVSPTGKGVGGNGAASSIVLGTTDIIKALGGGGGGINCAGSDGGSGGGGSKISASAGAGVGGASTDGQGHAGGLGSANGAGAGGGGAGSAGDVAEVANVGANGGLGKASTITGAEVWYAGGGGGGTRAHSSATSTGGKGGSGIGGDGAYGTQNAKTPATAGKDGTGSGGGGGCYNQAGGAGGSGIVIIRIKAVMPPKPPASVEFDYDGEEHLIYEGSDAVVIRRGTTVVDNISVKDVGEYTFTVSLKSGYTCWADGSTGNATCVVRVNAPVLVINSLTLDDWQEGETPSTPVIDSNIALAEGEYTLKYSTSATGPWSTTQPTAAGSYYITIEVGSSPNFQPPTAAMPVTPFRIWGWEADDKYLEELGYHAKLTITGYTGSDTLTNFPMLVRVSENSPNGFHYKHTNGKFATGGFDALDLRFIDSETGEILPCEVSAWDESGESQFWVKVPTYANGKSITMCWGELVGKDIPATPASTEVWTAFSGVWHMDEEISAADASNKKKSQDATANQNDATPTKGSSTAVSLEEMVSTEGMIGNGRVNSSHAPVTQGTYLKLSKTYAFNGVFTYSGWFRMYNATGYPRLGGNRTADGNGNNGTTSTGWSIENAQNRDDRFGMRYTGTNFIYCTYATTGTHLLDGWHYLSFVYNGTTVQFFADGVQEGSNGTIKNSVTDTANPISFGNISNGSSYSLSGAYDEIRLMPSVPSAGWVAADYAQVKDDEYYTWGQTLVTPNSLFKNRWVVEPSISKTEWPQSAAHGEVNPGEAAYGEPYFTFIPALGDTLTNDYPTAIGDYEFDVTVDAGSETSGTRSWEGLVWDGGIVSITAETPYQGLAGDESSSTIAGRVLLANDDPTTSADTAVTDQNYDYIDTTRPVYWTHEGEIVIEGFPRMNGRNMSRHTLMHNGGIDSLCGATNIWYLENVLIGNTYPSSQKMAADKNFLPCSSTSADIVDADHMIMRNIESAAIYSPCYTNGIGTIYFDVVNGWVSEDGENYKIVVEVATNCLNSAGVPSSDGRLPTDENVYQHTPAYETYDEMDDGTIVTNYFDAVNDRFGFADWHAVEMLPIIITNGTLTATNVTSELALAMNAGGSDQNFYRVAVSLNYRCPARFRIRRSSRYGDETVSADARFILIDNVEVSFPAMRADLAAYGKYDELRGGKQTLGQEAAWSIPFPSISDEEVFARAKPEYSVNPGYAAETENFVTTAKMHYRWRYLEQKDDGWRTVSLDPANDFNAGTALVLPEGLTGDVEYWFELKLNAPFYRYFDYAYGATGPGFGEFFTENISTVTNRRSTAEYPLPSRGTDWFVRLREGKSDFEGVNLVVRKFAPDGKEQATTNTVEMELVGDHIWRGYLKTLAETNAYGEVLCSSIKFRFEAFDRQTPGDTEWATNTTCWKIREDAESLPISETMDECTTNDWSSAPYDWTTGYYLFQIDDKTRSITAVHADYQSFNTWNDAQAGGLFVGTYTEDSLKSGASAKARAYDETFDDWLDMPASDPHWIESFTTTTDTGYPDYTTFPSADTPNGWSLGQGMLVFGNYKDVKTGRAFQMEGQGRGSISFVDSAVSPRGLESIQFNARLAQEIGLDKMAYYEADSMMSMSNYTFMTVGAFDNNSNKDFSGNATLSLFAYYRPYRGCYEFRVEQGMATISNGKVTGIAAKGQIASLYKWTYNSAGRLETQLLGSKTNSAAFNNYNWPSCSGSNGYQPLFLSIANSPTGTCIVAGFRADNNGVNTSYTPSSVSAKTYNCICYRDNTTSKLTAGTYGLASANCPAVFLGGYQFKEPISHTALIKPSNKIDQFKANTITFSTANVVDCSTQLSTDIDSCRWAVPLGRLSVFDQTTALKGIKAVKPTQELTIFTAPAGKTTGWKALMTFPFNSFGSSTSSGTTTKYNFYTTEDCSVKIAAAGDIFDVRTDLVIDDLVIRQWRGANWDINLTTNVIPNWVSENDYKAHTNFIFTSAWITNKTLLLSARRTQPGTPCSIRSPLMDGSYGRGKGLGMIAFKYKNAQENVNLLVQVATNVSYDTVTGVDNLDSALWSTVTNFSFAGLSAGELKSGSRSCYVGLHDVKGVMRILMDPAVVNSVSNEMNTARFGDIYIDEVFCRDEPALDASSWWGWNLRAIGADTTTGGDSEGRMYLPDLTDDLEKKGMSLALNHSVTNSIVELDAAKYPEHLPFLQTPTFGTNIVGEVAFRARKYEGADAAQPALVTLYGSKTGDENGEWKWLSNFVVSNTTYTSYSFKTDQNDNYRAFRLAIVGVEGASTQEISGQKSLPGRDGSGNIIYNFTAPVRVMIDETMVSEAVRARMAFRNVGAFRNRNEDEALNRTTYVENVTDEVWQPMCNESWGVQCEVFAAQLPDEVNLERTPRVKLYWMVGENPWGFESWRTNANAHSAWLAPATDTNLVYRSGYLMAEDAVIPPETAPGTVVQYGLDVIWYPVGSDKPVTNSLNMAGQGWSTPAWYDPVDKNAGAADWSAYTILDTVAPHWAWINEVNIFGEYDNTYQNSDRNCQYVEIAVPAEADITGWYVQLLEPQTGNGLVITNTLGTFGSGAGDKHLSPMKEITTHNASNMSFRVLANEASFYGGRLNRSEGEVDAIWNPGKTIWFTKAGEISAIDSIGLRLVRGSGIVEHEIVVRGHDWWADYGGDESENPTNYAAYLNRKTNSKNFFWVGSDDDAGVDWSLSVLTERGWTTNDWVNTVERTPGRINVGQNIDPDHPTPNGSSIIVYANLDNDFGHINHVLSDGTVTNASQILFVKRGSERGTNIVYRIDPWYEMGNATTNGRPVAATLVDAATRTYVLEGVGLGASNNVTVVAGAKIKDSLTEAGIDPLYREAILDWLGQHKDAWGNDWANPDSDEVRRADFVDYSAWLSNPAAEATSQLSLTEMYWLDMDPTMGDLALVAGTKAFNPNVSKSDGSTNMKIDVFMMTTNRTEDTASAWYGTNWTPYVLRGMDPGSTSWKYAAERSWRWTNETFNIKGVLQNGKTSLALDGDNWVALRWFVFLPDSFDQDTKTTSIEIRDPLGTDTPAFGEGWYDWVQEHGTCPVYLRWALDDDLKMFTTEILKKENLYDD